MVLPAGAREACRRRAFRSASRLGLPDGALERTRPVRTSLFIRCCDSSHCQSRGGAKGRTPLPGERGLPGDAVRLSMAKNPSPNPQILFPLLIFFRALSPPPLRAAFSATRVASALAWCSVGLLVLPFRGRTAASAVSRRFCFGAASPGEPRAVSRPVSPPHARARARPPRRTRVCYLGGDAALGGIFRGAIMVLESAGGAAGGAARPRAVTKGE